MGDNYVVARYDTLFSIAVGFGTTEEKLRELNNLGDEPVKLGHILKLPSSPTSPGTIKSITHTVQSNQESLSSLSLEYEVTVDDIRRENSGMNHFKSNKPLRKGQTLHIPVKRKKSIPVNFSEKKETLHSRYGLVEGSHPHIFKKGESLRGIAAHYGMDYDEMKRINKFSSGIKVKHGMVVYVIPKTPIPKKNKPRAKDLITGILRSGSSKQHSRRKRRRERSKSIDPRDVNQTYGISNEYDGVMLEFMSFFLIPHTSDSLIGLCSIMSDKMKFSPLDLKLEEKHKFPREFLYSDMVSYETIVLSDIIHSSPTSHQEGIKELSYIHFQMKPNDAIENLYMGLDLPHQKTLCDIIYDYNRDSYLEELKEKERPSDIELLDSNANREVGLPRLSSTSSIIRKGSIEKGIITIRNKLPSQFKFARWDLVYCTERDGFSLQTFYNNVNSYPATLLLFEDKKGTVFGAFIGGQWEITGNYTGAGESFVFQVSPQTTIYHWTQVNNCFFHGSHDYIEIGGGEPAIWIDKEFLNGTSSFCKTFGSPTLSSEEDFQCTMMEAYSFRTESLAEY